MVRYLVEIYTAEPNLAILLPETEKYAQYAVPTAMQVAYPGTRSASTIALCGNARDTPPWMSPGGRQSATTSGSFGC